MVPRMEQDLGWMGHAGLQLLIKELLLTHSHRVCRGSTIVATYVVGVAREYKSTCSAGQKHSCGNMALPWLIDGSARSF
jgi:hypothetical protein